MTKGREIIRVIPELDADPSSAATQVLGAGVGGKRGPFKVWVQDCMGTVVEAFEWKAVEKIAGVSIGAKMVLKKGCRVAHGIVLLEPERCVVLGGKVEAWDKVWREGREERLRKEVAEEARRGNEVEEDDMEYGD